MRRCVCGRRAWGGRLRQRLDPQTLRHISSYIYVYPSLYESEIPGVQKRTMGLPAPPHPREARGWEGTER